MAGLSIRETVWRIFDPFDSHPNAQRIARWLAAKKVDIPNSNDSTVIIVRRKRQDAANDSDGGGKVLREEGKVWRWIYDEVKKSKVFGLDGDSGSKLVAIKGGKLFKNNYGLALDPEPKIIPFHKVWSKLHELQEKNGGKMPCVLRNGMLIRVPKGLYVGIWRIFSAKATLTLDMAVPDKVSLKNKGVGQKREVSLKSLLKDDMTIIQTSLTGVVYKMK